MRVTVPLQGVVQGTRGLFWGSVIPCALFYFLQLFFKTKTRHYQPPPSHNHKEDSTTFRRSLSLTARHASASAYVSPRANSVTATNSSFHLGFDKVVDDPYHETHNPDGAQSGNSCQFLYGMKGLLMKTLDEQTIYVDRLTLQAVAGFMCQVLEREPVSIVRSTIRVLFGVQKGFYLRTVRSEL